MSKWLSMRSFQPDRLEQLENPALVQRLRPFLSECFEPISLQRPGFLEEIGLQVGDDLWLLGSSYYLGWSSTPIMARAWAEEARSKKLSPKLFLEQSQGLVDESLWRQAERIFLRCQQLARHGSPSSVASSLGISLKDYEALRNRWKAEIEANDQHLLDGIILHLRGCGPKVEEFVPKMEAQTRKRFLWFFWRALPILTQVSDAEIEPSTSLASPLAGGPVYSVATSFAREMAENAELSPELWAKQWADYLSKRKKISRDEFRAMLDHFEDKERFKWPNLVAVGGAKARRAVAAVALQALRRLGDFDDTKAHERLWQMIPDFSERYELQQLLKKAAG